MAFMLRDEIEEIDFIKRIRKESDSVFGITVRNWNFPKIEDKKRAMNNYINAVSKTMQKIINKYNGTFIFIPQVTVKSGDDTLIANKIKDGLPDNIKSRFVIRTDDWSPVEIKTIIGNLDYFIGTRMHSNIFATSMRIPTVAIAYEKKTNGIMKTVNLEEYIVEIDTITEEELITLVEKMINNKEKIIDNLNKRIDEIREEIMIKSTKIFKEEK